MPPDSVVARTESISTSPDAVISLFATIEVFELIVVAPPLSVPSMVMSVLVEVMSSVPLMSIASVMTMLPPVSLTLSVMVTVSPSCSSSIVMLPSVLMVISPSMALRTSAIKSAPAMGGGVPKVMSVAPLSMTREPTPVRSASLPMVAVPPPLPLRSALTFKVPSVPVLLGSMMPPRVSSLTFSPSTVIVPSSPVCNVAAPREKSPVPSATPASAVNVIEPAVVITLPAMVMSPSASKSTTPVAVRLAVAAKVRSVAASKVAAALVIAEPSMVIAPVALSMLRLPVPAVTSTSISTESASRSMLPTPAPVVTATVLIVKVAPLASAEIFPPSVVTPPDIVMRSSE